MLNNKPIYEFLKKISSNISEIVGVRIPKEKNAFKNELVRYIYIVLSCTRYRQRVSFSNPIIEVGMITQI